MKKTSVLDEESVFWMFDSFAWALQNFNAYVYFQETALVKPTNAFFPGQQTTPQGRAKLIFERVVDYAGVKHWPLQLMVEDAFVAVDPTKILTHDLGRGSKASQSNITVQSDMLPVTYNPAVLGDPQVLIATYAHTLAHYIATTAQEPPPGGAENWPHVTELLSVFLGFGLMMANSAFTAKIRSCASCSGPAIERTNFLSQYDITYALAIFCASKGIENNEVLPNLKSVLRSYYKRAIKDVKSRTDELGKLIGVGQSIQNI